MSYTGYTPFSTYIWNSLDLGDSRIEGLRVALLTWLEDLHDSGIDLEEYGRKELELYETGLTDRSFEITRYEGGEINNIRRCIARFVYGPLPSDWDVVLEEQERVPGKPARVPGAWIDDADDDDDDDNDDEVDEDDEDDNDEGDEGEDKDGRKEAEIEAS